MDGTLTKPGQINFEVRVITIIRCFLLLNLILIFLVSKRLRQVMRSRIGVPSGIDVLTHVDSLSDAEKEIAMQTIVELEMLVHATETGKTNFE
jgi:hypothetical protein